MRIIYFIVFLFTSIVLFLISPGLVAREAKEGISTSEPHDNTFTQISPWQQASYEIVTRGLSTYKTAEFGYVFSGKKNCIVKLAGELNGLRGIKLPDNQQETSNIPAIKLKFKEPVKVLIGTFKSSEPSYFRFDKGKSTLVLDSAVSITGLPSVEVHAVPYSKGTHTITPEKPGLYVILGVIKDQQLLARNAGMPDGRLWEPFIVEGFSEQPALFEISGGENEPVVDEGMAGTEGIFGGFEGGACVKIGDTYHMFPTERAGEMGIEAYYDRVKTRIGHWTSTDAIHWTRKSTIYQASGTYAITEDDNPLNDRRGAIWSYMPIFNKEKNRWYGYYLTYTVHKEIEPNHSFGRIWQAESQTEGMEGIGGPYNEGKLIIEPGLNSQPWEGRQGVASFFPFQVNNKWLGFYSGAYPFSSWADYPKKSGKGWFIGLAESSTIDGPWTRMDTTINPIRSIHPWFVENPIVYQMQNGLYLMVFDGGPEGWGHHLPNMIGYSLSADGVKWSEAHYLPIHTKVKKWWDIMRTPLCLIPESNGIYTIVYAAIQSEKRFHPMGMVRVKLNQKVLDAKLKELK